MAAVIVSSVIGALHPQQESRLIHTFCDNNIWG